MIEWGRMRAAVMWVACAVTSALSQALPGGVTGVVYVQGDASAPWVPLPGTAVIVDVAPTDTSSVAAQGLLTVDERGLHPLIQALNPGEVLRLVSRSSSIHRLQAQSEAGRRVFSLALTIPGLEIAKTLDSPGLITITCAERGHDHEVAYVFVSPHVGWAATDERGLFLIPGVPSGTRSIRTLHPEIGSAMDSVVVTPARAAERDLYLIRPAIPPVKATPENQ